MAQSFDSQSRTLGEVLGSNERRVILVPRFQRGFSWEKQHVSQFWTDLIAFGDEYQRAPISATYFFGPIVVQNQLEEIQLLDGQQRMATATILLASIRDVARTLKFVKGEPGHDLAYEIKANLIQKEVADPPFALRLGELDADYFRRTIQIDPPDLLEPKLRSHELIRSAYKTLREEVEKVVVNLSPEEAIKKLKQIKDSVSKGMRIVAINVESEDDAYSIFETLNDRGLRLSVPDLLLNLLMRRATTESERNQLRQSWNGMLEQMGRRDISRFLRHMWLSRYGDLKSRGLFYELKEHLNQKKIASVDFAESCALDCDFYIALVDQTKEIPKGAIGDVAGLVRYLGITSSLPLLLAGLQCLKDADFKELASFVAALTVRYSLIADLNPNTLETAFYEAARQIRAQEYIKEPSPKILQVAKVILKKLNPSDAIVKEKAREVVLDRAPALWLMTQLANYLLTKTKEVSIDEANLEHIFPKNATVANWPNKADLEPQLWKLGNLTILGEKLNRDASNKAFNVKVTNYYKDSELTMTKQITKYSSWTPKEVSERSAEMADLLTKVFIIN